ncbi:hypothetical protein CF319_g8507 [Tilletia indica]|nr:hypothetical protein CF319_g8507 [Tilletia indica]
MKYVAGTVDFHLTLSPSSDIDVRAFSDADHGGDMSARSTSGWCIQVFGATIGWGSKLQPLISDSTAQAEIMAVWQTSKEVLAIRHFLDSGGSRSSRDRKRLSIYDLLRQ